MLINSHHYYVYIITNSTRKVLYTGVTNNLSNRLIEHYNRKGTDSSFAGKYYCYWLVFYEEFKYVTNAIVREKELKGWSRKKKEALITSFNSTWLFLNKEICGDWPPEASNGKAG